MRLLPYMAHSGHFWIRLWNNGPGIRVKDTRRHSLLFSQRNGYSKFLMLGPWWVSFLPRWRMAS